MEIESRLKRITSLTSMVIALAITISMPLGYFITSYNYEAMSLEEQANLSADALSKHIYSHPNTWQFQDHRLEDILIKGSWLRAHVQYQVLDMDAKEITTIGAPSKSPYHSVKAALTDGEKQVGWVETQASLSPLFRHTLFVTFGALMIAWSVRYALRVLPFAALNRVITSLAESQQQLAREIEAKENALQEYRRVSEEMHYQAMHDTLTGLPNRAALNRHLTKNFEQAQRGFKQFTVMILDLNRFKEINDALGHQVGDEVLLEVSKRIRKTLPTSTILARLGGDEFAILVPDAITKEALHQAESIINALHSHIIVNEYHLAIQGSIGIAHYPQHGKSPEKILRHADVAMYHAKRSALPFCLYDSNYDENSPNKLTLTADLRQAIDSKDLTLYYQPKIDIQSGEIMGVEALARWQHPEFGFISPDVFIPIAEQAGMINPLTTWVIDSALQQLATWQASGMYLAAAVNISAYNLQNKNLPQQIKTLLENHTVRAQCLTLEITESSIMADPAQTMELIKNLTELGVKIAVDDFGTGYSSLAYLKKFTVHELKIDRSFVTNMLHDPEDQVIVRSTIELAHNLKLFVVAEGVENQDTYEMLKKYGCDFVQGYHICEPVPAVTLENWLKHPQNTVFM